MVNDLLNRFPWTTKRWLPISVKPFTRLLCGRFSYGWPNFAQEKLCDSIYAPMHMHSIVDLQSQLINSTKFISEVLNVASKIVVSLWLCECTIRVTSGLRFGFIETCFNWNKILNVVHDKCQMMRFCPAIMMITKYCVFLSSQVMRNIVCIT